MMAPNPRLREAAVQGKERERDKAFGPRPTDQSYNRSTPRPEFRQRNIPNTWKPLERRRA